MVLSLLGRQAALPLSPEAAILECADCPSQDIPIKYLVRFTCPEFTSLCPITGQPDFAHIVIDYVPDKLIIESKSLKLFLASFRDHGAFHEKCTIYIADRLMQALGPIWFRIGAYWFPRGGIPIDIFWQSGDAPAGLWLPPQEVPSYRGR